ncbi:MAG: hypothetical protein ACR2KL_08560 [Nocardioidaceae bacterium]
MSATARGPFDTLPSAVDFSELVATQDTGPVPDPQGGRDSERDFMLRYGAAL